MAVKCSCIISHSVAVRGLRSEWTVTAIGMAARERTAANGRRKRDPDQGRERESQLISNINRLLSMFSLSFFHCRRPEGRHSDSVSNVSVLHYTGCHRRPVNRVSRTIVSQSESLAKVPFEFPQNSNLLSATLCLIKELDYGSLEVLEHAVRCRIDELAGE